jgi:uncharacterized protein YyaL (SSP411 family)
MSTSRHTCPPAAALLLQAATGSKAGGKGLSAAKLLSASLHSLQAMAAGGMYDQLGGGFHRYRWGKNEMQ